MATESENLQTALANIAARLAEITASPKPSYSVDGESYSWTEYFQSLLSAREALKQQLIDSQGPYEIRSRGV